jgi:hypothetical protein
LNFGVQLGLNNMNTDFSASSLVAYSLRNTTLENEFSPSSWATMPSNTTNGVTAQVGLRHGLRGWRWQAWDCWARRFLWTTGASSDSRIQ